MRLGILLSTFLFSIKISAQPSHQLFTQVLKNVVDEDGMVNYKTLKASPQKLDTYLNLLQKQTPDSDWSRHEKMAYWINAYNAFTLKVITQHYPLESITDIEVDGAENIWKKKFIVLEGKSFSLDQIEHQILRPKFKDPRIHFAVNCASFSCPKIWDSAFDAEKLDEQLTQRTKAFLNDEERNEISPNSLKLSAIFNWFKSDFTQNGTLIDFLNKYSEVNINSSASISYLDYDWSLNESEK